MAAKYGKISLCLNFETIEKLGALAKKKDISKSAVSRLLLKSGTDYLMNEWEV